MIALGELSLWVALLMAACATLAVLIGGARRRADVVRAGEFALVVTGLCALTALVGLGVALLRQEYALAYVASHV
ncbi:MAG: heme lyase CcmF/NrfE family subunit, partial [Gemmatimonadaceae bacterium]|nr:heme lyase CcmF/NrfE family subunit [Gemmatimonadaceae bacterium]